MLPLGVVVVVVFGLVVALGVVVVIGEVVVLGGVLMVGDVPTGGQGTAVVVAGPVSVVVVPGVADVVLGLVEVDGDPEPT